MSSARLRRLMREYTHNAIIEGQRKATNERKERLKEFMSQGKMLPKDIRNDAFSLLKATTYDDNESKFQDELDNEYANVGVEDPLVAVTTSRDPSGPIKTFAREISQLIPNSQRFNRGALDVKGLGDLCRRHNITDLVIVNGTHGDPDALIVSHMPYGPTATFSLKNVVMRRDVENAPAPSTAFPHLIFEDLSSKLGKRVKDILQALFPVPKPESKRLLSFINRNDWISFRQHNFTKHKGKIELEETGPRMEMRPFKIVRGAIDQMAPDIEYVFHAFINSRRELLKAREDEIEKDEE